MKVRLRATYSTTEWEGEDEDPIIGHGYADPNNPWGGFTTPMDEPDSGPAIPHPHRSLWRRMLRKPISQKSYRAHEALRSALWEQWTAENVETVVCDNLWEAAEFVVDFPGGVWDFREGEYSTEYRTGIDKEVTLHVEDHDAAVFEIAEFIQKRQDARLARMRGTA